MLPEDPIMLLSYVNTQLRDFYPNLQEFCAAEGADAESLRERLRAVNYEYDEKMNRFV